MTEQLIKSLLHSAAHTLVGVAGGAMIDSFFHAKESEDGLAHVGLFGIQTALNGALISAILGASLGDDGSYQDPTGGAFLIFSTLYSQTNYRRRLEQIASQIQNRTTMLLPTLPSGVAVVKTEDLNK